MQVSADRVTSAANNLGFISFSAFVTAAIALLLLEQGSMVVPCVAASAGVTLLLRESVLGYPSRAARRKAEEVLKDSTRSTNLMIMSLGHEASISKAIMFASRDENPFSEELRGCVWAVVMGTCASFEEALHALGSRWARFSAELKATANSMVTASCESTEDGKRRALDRANNAMIVGAKRRIEEYALSLSTPSMVMFGLGILLPLMVGSFLPMLSWNMWSFGSAEMGSTLGGGDESILQTVFLMNVLFPALAFLVASNAISHHPLETKGRGCVLALSRPFAVAAGILSLAGVWLFANCLDGFPRSAGMLISGTVPLSVLAVIEGARMSTSDVQDGGGVEDALFVTGARMLEGENFEAALERAASDLDERSAKTIRSLSFRSNIVGQELDSAIADQEKALGGSNALEAFKVVREAAEKDEAAAGLLAMDLAAYLKDLHDLDDTLKGRLKPTISMMRATAFALGPIVMGVTYAIFVSMGSVMGEARGGFNPDSFLLVLGAFLAETGILVSYFVWGIEGRGSRSSLLFAAGSCVAVSELIFTATSFLASR